MAKINVLGLPNDDWTLNSGVELKVYKFRCRVRLVNLNHVFCIILKDHKINHDLRIISLFILALVYANPRVYAWVLFTLPAF
jgi:hypothetical protein